MKVERKADHAVSESSCKSATGKTLAEWFKALDKHGGVALGRRDLSKWIEHEQQVELWWATTITNEYEIARGDLAKDGKPKGYSICPTKSIKASPKDCYAAFATAKALDGWFGPKHEVDMRDGGQWRNARRQSRHHQEGQRRQEHPAAGRGRGPHAADTRGDQVHAQWRQLHRHDQHREGCRHAPRRMAIAAPGARRWTGSRPRSKNVESRLVSSSAPAACCPSPGAAAASA